MSKPDILLVGIDIGTTNLKAVALRPSGHVEAIARRAMLIERPSAGAAEFNLDALDRDLFAVLREVADTLSAKGINLQEVAGIGIASIGESFVGLDAEDRRVTPCPTWYDRRTQNLRKQWNLSPKTWFDITGMVDDDIYTGYRISWWRTNKPEACERVRTWLMVADYAVLRLCGSKVTHPSLAARSGLADRRTGLWSDELLSSLRISNDNFAKIRPAGTVAGELTPEAAKTTGLPRGIPIINAGHDHPCAGLGCGLVDPGRIIDSMGTAESIITVVTSALTFEEVDNGAYDCYPHAIKGRYLLSGHTPSAGGFFDWLVTLLAGPEKNGHAVNALWRAAAATAPGSKDLRIAPYLTGTGSPWNKRDQRADISFLSYGADAGSILRAAVEALAAWLALNVGRFEKITGLESPEITLTGGGARNDLSNAVKAALINRPLTIPSVDEAAGAGAALVAGLAVGAIEDAAHISSLPATHWRTIDVNKELAAAYSSIAESLQAHITPIDQAPRA